VNAHGEWEYVTELLRRHPVPGGWVYIVLRMSDREPACSTFVPERAPVPAPKDDECALCLGSGRMCVIRGGEADGRARCIKCGGSGRTR